MNSVIINRLEQRLRELEGIHAEILKAQDDFQAMHKRRMQRLNLALSELAALVSLEKSKQENS
jgi:DNA-directed RNA polymerase specialized sigma54-like protein